MPSEASDLRTLLFPDHAAAESWRLLQAEALLREAGYVERDGKWVPLDDV